MEISIFDSDASIVTFENKFVSVGSYILIADSLTMSVNSAWANTFALDIDLLSEEKVIAIWKDLQQNNKESLEAIIIFEQIFLEIKKTKNQKRKDRLTMDRHAYIRTGIVHLRKECKRIQNNFFLKNDITGLKPFINEKVWQFPFFDFLSDLKKEDVFILPIKDVFTKQESFLGIDSIIETLFPYTTFDSNEKGNFDFIKIPLWDIPFAKGMSFERLKYTRADLQPVVLPFKANLNKLSEALFPICFIPENIQQIKQLCNEKLSDHIAPVQQSIYESLYIQQLLNQNPQIPKLKLCMGIASAETLINYYEKTKLVLPYVVTEIKQQSGRFIDLKASYVFTYLEVLPDVV